MRLQHSIAVRFLAISAIAVVALVPVRLLELHDVRDRAERDGKLMIADLATSRIERLTSIIDEAGAILSMVSLLPQFSAPGTPNCHELFTPIVAESAWMMSLSAVGADGRISCSSTSSAEQLLVGSQSYYREAATKNGFHVSDVVVSRVTKAPTMLASMPVHSARGGTAALLIGINASLFTGIGQELGQLMPGSVAMIVNASGKVIVDSDENEDYDLTSLTDELARMDREKAQRLTLPNGRTLFVAVREIPHSSSLLVIGVPQAKLHQNANSIEKNALQDLAVGIGIIVLIFWLSHESFVRPVLTLAAAAKRIGRGKFDVTIDSRRWASEYQTLASAITEAAASLANRAQADAALKASLRAQSQEDPLTGLKNRRGLDQFVDIEWQICLRRSMTFSAIAFDIDFFKPFNDHYGHDAGDAALKAVSQIMRSQATELNGLAARTGGEEFTIVMPGGTSSGAKAIADAVALRVTALRIPHAGSPLGLLTISAGIATATATPAVTYSDIFRAADKALYGAKESGRNTITVGTVSTDPRFAPRAAAGFETPEGSTQDTESRTPRAFPSAMSR